LLDRDPGLRSAEERAMDGINKVMIHGNLGADPELRMLTGGIAMLKMRVATNERWLDKENVRQEKVEWHRVTLFGRSAEGLAKFARKGMAVFVEGRLQTTSYDKDGQKHYSTEIIADRVTATGSPRSSGAENLAGGEASFGEQAVPPPSMLNGGRARVPSAAAATDIPF
jgi:single-strand DNA-binding protein